MGVCRPGPKHHHKYCKLAMPQCFKHQTSWEAAHGKCVHCVRHNKQAGLAKEKERKERLEAQKAKTLGQAEKSAERDRAYEAKLARTGKH
ncbi:hypothetical protein LTR65_003445 [Meristemomyces frigidus]